MKWAGFARPFESNPGSPQKRKAFVRGVPPPGAGDFWVLSRPGATYFCHQTKVGKSWLRGKPLRTPGTGWGLRGIARGTGCPVDGSPGGTLN